MVAFNTLGGSEHREGVRGCWESRPGGGYPPVLKPGNALHLESSPPPLLDPDVRETKNEQKPQSMCFADGLPGGDRVRT